MNTDTRPAPSLAAAVMLADELAFHLMLEFLAGNAPGFSDYFTTHTTRLIDTGNMPAPTEEALSELRDHVAYCAAGGV